MEKNESDGGIYFVIVTKSKSISLLQNYSVAKIRVAGLFQCFCQAAVATLFLSIMSCRPASYTPKPPGYFKIDTPDSHQYHLFDRPGFPYSFEYPVYSVIKDDSVFQSQKEKNPYWVNIEFPSLGAVINITYKDITPDHPFMKLVDEADNLSFFHHNKADYIDQRIFRTSSGVSGILYVVGGSAATRYQFTATDSTKHFMRGALYFDVTPNADSLKPATDFLEKDISRLISTLKWR